TRPERDVQIAIIDEAFNNFHRYYFTMPMLARLEIAMHQRVERGEGMTADFLIKSFAEFLSEGYGSEVEVDEERDGIHWAEFTHLYANFYVFQYTTGIAAAHTLAQRILSGQPGSVERYQEFLKTGGAAYPLDALMKAGVDMRSPEPIETTFGVL